MPIHIDVFVSSTQKDMAAYRAKVRDIIIQNGMYPIMMEDFPAVSRDAVDLCRAKVEEGELFIGIYAQRYGYCPNGGDKSITELEYEWGKAHKLDRLIFVLDENADLPSDDPVYLYADHNPHMQEFLGRVGKEIVWRTFRNPDHLALQVSQSLREWQNRPNLLNTPRWTLVFIIVSVLVSAGLGIEILWRLLQANAPLLSYTLPVITFFMSLLPWIVFSNKGIQSVLARLPIRSWWLGMAIQGGLAVALLLGRTPFLHTLAEQQLDQAFTATDLEAAQNALSSADYLGAAIRPALEDQLNQALAARNHNKVDWYSTLYRQQIGSEAAITLAAGLLPRVDRAAEATDIEATLLLAHTITRLDPAQATEVANRFNDASVAAQSSNPPDLRKARTYLEAVRLIDELGITGRSAAQQSISRYNLALQQELLGEIDLAVTTYREAIALNDGNLEARHALSSLQLVRYESNPAPDLLEEAILLARTGWEDYIDIAFCRGEHDLSDDATFLKVWNCFALMTTEAGARTLRAGAQDIPETILPLLERAIQLVEANNQFRARPGYYTAEVYYWWSQSQPAPDQETLCNIIRYHNRSNPRHRVWVAYANTALSGAFCN